MAVIINQNVIIQKWKVFNADHLRDCGVHAHTKTTVITKLVYYDLSFISYINYYITSKVVRQF